jgi:hypothetical protein
MSPFGIILIAGTVIFAAIITWRMLDDPHILQTKDDDVLRGMDVEFAEGLDGKRRLKKSIGLHLRILLSLLNGLLLGVLYALFAKYVVRL